MADEPTSAPVDVPAATSGQAESEVVKTIPEAGAPEKEAAPVEAEAKPEGQEDKPDAEGEESSSEDKPRKPSRSERMRRRIAAMATELDNYRAQVSQQEKTRETSAKDATPKEADFNGDYFAFQAAKAAYDARQAVRAEFEEREQRDKARDIAKREREATEEFFERVEDIKPRIPDFDSVVEKYHRDGGKFAPHVQEELRESDKGAALIYHLAKNPGVAAELNALSPRDAAREIGRLEAKLSLPQPKKQTQAPAPLKQPTGGASPSKSLDDLAKLDDISAYVKAREEMDKGERRR